MKATVDIPDQLYRRVKAQAALEGRAVRDVTIQLYEHWLGDRPPGGPIDRRAASEAWLARWQALGEEIATRARDPRTTRRILTDDRR